MRVSGAGSAATKARKASPSVAALRGTNPNAVGKDGAKLPLPLNLSQSSGDVDTALQLRLWLQRYEKSKRPVKVNFRTAVPWLRSGDRATHYIHPYPGKLLPQIAYFFTHASTLSKRGDTILDPFAGTGTVGLEAMLAGRDAILLDSNPLATLVASVKTLPLSRRRLRDGVSRLQVRLKSRRLAPLPSVVNLDHWYKPTTIRSLRQILLAIEAERSRAVRHFFLVCFSVLARKVSLCDPRLSVPVRLKPQARNSVKGTRKKKSDTPSVRKIFDEIVSQNIQRVQELYEACGSGTKARVIDGDARALFKEQGARRDHERVLTGSVQLVISSPPYGGAQKYIRASSLSLGWLRLAQATELRALEEKTIGREHFHKKKYERLQPTYVPAADRVLRKIARRDALRACISSTYLREMRSACGQMVRALKPGGYLVLVIGNNLVARIPFLTSRYLTHVLRNFGLELQLRLIDDIKSRGLMTKRNKTASVISREWVLLFRKPRKRCNV